MSEYKVDPYLSKYRLGRVEELLEDEPGNTDEFMDTFLRTIVERDIDPNIPQGDEDDRILDIALRAYTLRPETVDLFMKHGGRVYIHSLVAVEDYVDNPVPYVMTILHIFDTYQNQVTGIDDLGIQSHFRYTDQIHRFILAYALTHGWEGLDTTSANTIDQELQYITAVCDESILDLLVELGNAHPYLHRIAFLVDVVKERLDTVYSEFADDPFVLQYMLEQVNDMHPLTIEYKVHLLRKYNAAVNSPDPVDGHLPLVRAIHEQNIDALQVLLEAGADTALVPRILEHRDLTLEMVGILLRYGTPIPDDYDPQSPEVRAWWESRQVKRTLKTLLEPRGSRDVAPLIYSMLMDSPPYNK